MGGQSWNLENKTFLDSVAFFLQTLRHLATLPGQPGPDQDLGHTELLPLQVLHLLVAAFRLGRRVRDIIIAQNLCQTKLPGWRSCSLAQVQTHEEVARAPQ